MAYAALFMINNLRQRGDNPDVTLAYTKFQEEREVKLERIHLTD